MLWLLDLCLLTYSNTANKARLFRREFCFVCWLLNVQGNKQREYQRQFYVLPHWDRSCRSNFQSHPVAVNWHQTNQSHQWPYNARCLAGQPLEYQFLSHKYDSTGKQDLNPPSPSLEANTLSLRHWDAEIQVAMELSISSSHSKLKSDQPVLPMTLV